MNKPGGFIDLTTFDDTTAILDAGERRSADRRLPIRERKAKAKEKAKAAARKGRRALYDLSPELIEQVKQLAENSGTTASQIAALLLTIGLDQVTSGSLKIDQFLEPICNPQYSYRIRLPENVKLLA